MSIRSLIWAAAYAAIIVWAGLSMGWQAAVFSMGAACAACMAMKSDEEDGADEG